MVVKCSFKIICFDMFGNHISPSIIFQNSKKYQQCSSVSWDFSDELWESGVVWKFGSACSSRSFSSNSVFSEKPSSLLIFSKYWLIYSSNAVLILNDLIFCHILYNTSAATFLEVPFKGEIWSLNWPFSESKMSRIWCTVALFINPFCSVLTIPLI